MKPQNTPSSLPIGKAIYAFRLKNHISQRELAAKMNVSPQAVYKWENGTSYPEIQKLIEIKPSVFKSALLKGSKIAIRTLLYANWNIDVEPSFFSCHHRA